MRTWRTQLKQGEPEFERLKRELEEVKHSHRGLDGTYRSQVWPDSRMGWYQFLHGAAASYARRSSPRFTI